MNGRSLRRTNKYSHARCARDHFTPRFAGPSAYVARDLAGASPCAGSQTVSFCAFQHTYFQQVDKRVRNSLKTSSFNTQRFQKDAHSFAASHAFSALSQMGTGGVCTPSQIAQSRPQPPSRQLPYNHELPQYRVLQRHTDHPELGRATIHRASPKFGEQDAAQGERMSW